MPLRISMITGWPVYTTAAPGLCSCRMVKAASISAFICTRSPARVTGAVAPDTAEELTSTGMPSSAETMAASNWP